MSLTTSVSNLRNAPPRTLRMQIDQMKDSNSSKKSQMNLEQVLEVAFQEIRELKAEVERLKSPQLMYKRPGSDKHEKITEFFDDVEIRLQKLEK